MQTSIGMASGHAAGGSAVLYAVGAGGIGSVAGDGTAAAIALEPGLAGLATDGSGDLFMADGVRVLELPVNGTTRIVNPGSYTFDATAVAMDPSGDLFIADLANDRVIEIPGHGGASQGSPHVVNTGSYPLASPQGLAVDSAGDLFIADTGSNRVVEVPAVGGVAASGPATAVNTAGYTLSYAQSVAADPSGDLFIDGDSNFQVVEVPAHNGIAANGTPSEVNTGSYTVAPNGVLATNPAGTLYIGDRGSADVVKVPAANGVAASGTPSRLDTGTFINAGAYNTPNPLAMTVDPAGDVLIADNHFGIVKVPTNSVPVVATIVNTENPLLAGCLGVAVDGDGDLFFVRADTNQVTELPAQGAPHLVKTGSLTLNAPAALAANAAGDLFIADTYNNRIIEVRAHRGVAATGAATVVQVGQYPLSYPRSLAVDPAGNLFIADPGHKRLVEVPANGGPPRVVDTTDNDFPLHSAPGLVTVDAEGDVFEGDYSNRVLEVAAVHGAAASGTPTVIYTPTNTLPSALAVTAAGDLFIEDVYNPDPSMDQIVELPTRGGHPASGTARVVATDTAPWVIPYGIAAPPAMPNTVTFNTEGGSPPPPKQRLDKGAYAKAPRPPTKAGFRFTGWNTHRDGSGRSWRFASDPVTSNLTLHAQYRPTPG